MRYKKFQISKSPPLLLPVAAALFTYTALRAYLLSLTHDECGSFDMWLHYDIFGCKDDPGCWSTANLHWLYVLLMKATVGLFGNSELAIRLPALLAHGLYLFFSYKLVKKLPGETRDTPPWLALCGFLLLNVNPYLLEFFSLARGYGLAMGLMMMSLYFFARYTESGRTAHITGAVGGAALAVLANFTQLNYLACLLAVSAVAVLPVVFSEKKAWKKWLLPAGIVLAACGLLSWLLRKPVVILRQRGEFDFGAPAFWDFVRSLIKASLYRGSYLKMYNAEFFASLLALFLGTALVFSAVKFFKNPLLPSNRFSLATALLPIMLMLCTEAQHRLLGSQYLYNRTALLLLPAGSLAVFILFFYLWKWKTGIITKILPLLVSGFCVFHLLRVAQFDRTYEWSYDARTKDMVLYLKSLDSTCQPMKLGVKWLYHPATVHYMRQLHLENVTEPDYRKEMRRDSLYDFYYVFPSDTFTISPAYVPEKKFDRGGWLMRRQ